MTRNEVCCATGLPIQTLRLYEETGLIVPAYSSQNDPEECDYSTALVEQLRRVVILRRALFTMEEIKAMQQDSDAIPGVFQAYRQWLGVQGTQARALRHAAAQIEPQSLHSIDDLLHGIRQAAGTMPLPQMDLDPDLRHADAIQEPSHQLEPLGDSTADPRTLRQMSLALDQNRDSRTAVLLGQYNECRQAGSEESTPVSERHTLPRWQKLLGGLLTVLTFAALIGAIYQVLAHQQFDGLLWGLFALFLLLRLGLAAIPLWQSHKKWRNAAQQKDAEAGGAQYAAALAADKKRRLRLVGLVAGIGIPVIILTAVLCRVLYTQAHPQADYAVGLLTSAELSQQVPSDLSAVLSPMVEDRDGNGTALCQVEQRVLYWALPDDPLYLTAADAADCAANGTYCLLLFLDYDHPNYENDPQYRNAVNVLSRPASCAPLQEDIPSEDGYFVDLSQVSALRCEGLGDLGLYACIPIGDSPEDYAAAVSILRQLLQNAA